MILFKTQNILTLLLIFLIAGCNNKSPQLGINKSIERKPLSVIEAQIEKKMAQLKFCEAIFATDLFNLTYREQLIHGKKCYLLWTADNETILNTSTNFPKASKRLLDESIVSRSLAKRNDWIREANNLYRENNQLESNFSTLSENCKSHMLAGDLNNEKEVVEGCLDATREKYLLEKSFTLVL